MRKQEYFTQIPLHKDYLVSNKVKIYRKTTWRCLATITKGTAVYCKIKFNGKKKKINVTKLVQKLFPYSTKVLYIKGFEKKRR